MPGGQRNPYKLDQAQKSGVSSSACIVRTMLAEDEYKLAKEAFVSGHSGTSLAELNLVFATTPVCSYFTCWLIPVLIAVLFCQIVAAST